MKKRRGFSLIEVMMMITFMTIVLTGATMMTINTGKSFNRSTNQLQVDQHAMRGIQWISQDMQEAKSFQILATYWIKLYYPVQAVDGTYNRKITDTVNTIEYYRGTANGTRDANGKFLIRSKAGGTTRDVITDIYALNFESDSPSSVTVDVQTRLTVSGKTYNAAMNHRAILMRNYQQ